jgi:TolB-like protein
MDRLEYRVGRFALQPFRQLLDEGAPVSIGRKALDLLSVLAQADGALVTKEELMATVWASAIVEENAIQVHVAALRRLLGKDAQLLCTVHGLGYRLTADPKFTREAKAAGLERAPISKPTIVVLPLANLTGEHGQDHFADGLTEEIATSLSRCRSMSVVASAPSLTPKDKRFRPQDAALDPGVRYLLEGSIRKAGSRARVAVKLIDATDGRQLWAGRFDESLDDVLAFQDKVALAVAGAIEPAVQTAEVRRVLKQPSENPSSYELHMQALHHCRRRSLSEYRIALDLLDRAVALDPNHRVSLALAAHLHSQIAFLGWAEDPEANRLRGLELAYRAIMNNSDDATALAHAAVAVARLDGDPDAAAALLERAVALNPARPTSGS